MSNVKIKNALLSVSNKENLLDVVKVLNKYKIGIISSEGTHKYLKEKGVVFSKLTTKGQVSVDVIVFLNILFTEACP